MTTPHHSGLTKVGERDAALRHEHERIERAQAHGTREVFDRHFLFAEADSHPAAERPRQPPGSD